MFESREKTIAILSNTSWSIYNFRRGLVRKLSDEGYKILIICPPDQYTEKLKPEPCLFVPVQLSRHKINPFLDLKYAFQIFQILKRYQPDFLISYTIKPNIYAQLAARLLKIPRLGVVTGLGYLFIGMTWKTQIVKRLYRFSFKGANRVWFLNKEDEALFLNNRIVTEQQTGYLPSEGVDITYFRPENNKSEHGVSIIYAGRLIREKGVPEFVQAARILKAEFPEVTFQIAGFIEKEAPGAIQLADIKAWQKENIIQYKGAKADIRPILSNSDCVVLPTYYREGVPRILLEAASMGKIIVGTNTPGCKDIITEGHNGFLCEPKHSEHLAETIRKILKLTPEERTELGEHGRAIVEAEFREEFIIQKYLELLETVLGNSKQQQAPAKINFD
ncbi:MAG: glycosyltransferase family 4 protein [Phaeodactylibacter sp.]|nr:glycosyltransferase family 4 protein [Phaeodactylibacter sp.]